MAGNMSTRYAPTAPALLKLLATSLISRATWSIVESTKGRSYRAVSTVDAAFLQVEGIYVRIKLCYQIGPIPLKMIVVLHWIP